MNKEKQSLKLKFLQVVKNFGNCYYCQQLGLKPKNVFFTYRCIKHKNLHFCDQCGTMCKLPNQLKCFSCIEVLGL